MWHAVFIVLHTLGGVVALAAGCVAVRRGSLFAVYFWSLVAMVALLVPTLASHWADIQTSVQVLFVGLLALGGFMIWRAAQARAMLPIGSAGPSARYVDHVGFTLVALSDGFLIIAVLDLGAPGWLAGVTGVAVALAGHFVLRVVKKKLVTDGRGGSHHTGLADSGQASRTP